MKIKHLPWSFIVRSMTCWTELTDWQKIPIIYNIQCLMVLFVLSLGLFLLFEETTP